MLGERRAAVCVLLHLPNGFTDAGPLEPKLKPTDAREQGTDSHGATATLVGERAPSQARSATDPCYRSPSFFARPM